MNVPREAWLDLLSEMCCGTLSDAQWAALDDHLQSSREFRTLYADYMQLHVELRAQLIAGRREAGSDPEPYRKPATDVDARREEASHAPFPQERLDRERRARHPDRLVPSRSRTSRRGPRAVTAAALVCVAAAASSLLTLAIINPQPGDRPAARQADDAASANRTERGDSSGTAEPATPPPDRSVVAEITSTQNCRWGEPRGADVGFGARLYLGQRLVLERGVAQITFNKGAKIVLEAPADFTVTSPSDGLLIAGRLAAAVPPQAQGFTIRTASVQVVDLGTEFGVLADQGGSEVHVFRGEVVADVLDAAGKTVRQLRLVSDQAARLTRDSPAVLQFAADNDEFVRSIDPSGGSQVGLYAYESFDYPIGPLSAMHGGFGWDGAWFNIRTASREGTAASNRVIEESLASGSVIRRGNRAAQTGQQNRIRRTLNTAVGGTFDRAGLVENQDGVRLVGRDATTVYMSVLQKVSKLSDGFYGVEVHRGDGNANRVLCLGNGAEGCGYGVTSNYNRYGKPNFPELGTENEAVNFFVIRFTFGADNEDEVVVYRNPESVVDEASCVPDARLTGNFAFDRVSLGNFDGTKTHEVDEIRIGTKFLAVTGQRAPLGDQFTRSTLARLR